MGPGTELARTHETTLESEGMWGFRTLGHAVVSVMQLTAILSFIFGSALADASFAKADNILVFLEMQATLSSASY